MKLKVVQTSDCNLLHYNLYN